MTKSLRKQQGSASEIIFDSVKEKRCAQGLVFLTSALGLVGCGGGGTDSATNTNISLPTSTTPGAGLLQGSVVKGPLKNALVFADYDGDGVFDSNEPSTRTAADGSFSLQSAVPTAGFVAITDETTTDTFTGSPVTGLTLKAPAGATVVTPATTLYVEIVEKNPEITTTDLASALGLEDVNILEFNPFSEDADPEIALQAEKVASQIITTITSISAAGEGAGATKEQAFDKALEAVTSVVSTKLQSQPSSGENNQNNSEASSSSSKIDFADSALLTEVSAVAKTELATVVSSPEALNTVLDTSVEAIQNVNDKIESAQSLSDKESVAAFTVTSELTTQVLNAVKQEVESPGSATIEFSNTENVASSITSNAENVVLIQPTSGNGGDSAAASPEFS